MILYWLLTSEPDVGDMATETFEPFPYADYHLNYDQQPSA